MKSHFKYTAEMRWCLNFVYGVRRGVTDNTLTESHKLSEHMT